MRRMIKLLFLPFRISFPQYAWSRRSVLFRGKILSDVRYGRQCEGSDAAAHFTRLCRCYENKYLYLIQLDKENIFNKSKKKCLIIETGAKK
jgi:hypothetical protein